MSMQPDFTFEHVALNVPDRERAEKWYAENLGLTVARSVPGGACFLADPTGRVVFELYANPAHASLDFGPLHPLTFHVAFVVSNLSQEAARLSAAGARVVEELKTVNGDTMIMMRDPFGMGLQLMKRKDPMF